MFGTTRHNRPHNRIRNTNGGSARKPDATTFAAMTKWLRGQPYVVVGAGLLVGITLGYWSKRA